MASALGEKEWSRKDRLELLWDRFHSLQIAEKMFSEMTLEDKGLLLQLGVVDLFEDKDPPRPSSDMTPEAKGALLLWYIAHGHPLYKSELNSTAPIGGKLITELCLDFSSTNLNMLGLCFAKLYKGNFRKANARDAVLSGVDFTGASLEEANLEGAYMNSAVLRNCNLKNCIGFPLCRDALIDVDTYERSEWTPAILQEWHRAGAKIVGLDEFQADAVEAILKGFHADTPPVFLSYGGCDSDIATQIATHLESQGLRVWFAPWDIDYGDDVIRRIEQGLEVCRTFLILLSPESLERPWVRQELSSALSKALNEPGREIIPIRYKPCELPAFLSTRKWLDLKVPYLDPLNDLCRRLRGEPTPRIRLGAREASAEMPNYLAEAERLLGNTFSILGRETVMRRRLEVRKKIVAIAKQTIEVANKDQAAALDFLLRRCMSPLEGVWGEWPAPVGPKPNAIEECTRELKSRFPELLQIRQWLDPDRGNRERDEQTSIR